MTDEDKNIFSLTEPKEPKEPKEEEKTEVQTNEVETPDLIRNTEAEGEPVVALTSSSEIEVGGNPERNTSRRKMLSKQQLAVLKSVYKSKPYLTLEENNNLASNINLSRKQVKSWFTQRRYNQKGAESDGLHHCAFCDKTYKSRASSLAHRQKHSNTNNQLEKQDFMDFPTLMTTQPFSSFTFEPNIGNKM